MKRNLKRRRRPAVHITPGRAARLHHLVVLLAERPRSRSQVLAGLGIGLRTFYRELEMLRRCGVKTRLTGKTYTIQGTAAQAEGKLPFPDPRLSFAELSELSRCPGETGRRLAELLRTVVTYALGGSRGRPTLVNDM
jgi:hypothetical protein